MRAQILKFVLPLLVAIALFAVPAAMASEHGQAAMHGEPAAHEAAATVEHGAVHAEHAAAAGVDHAAVAHGAAAGGEHAAAAHEGGGHRAPMITAAKLKDLFWRTANFLALVIILVKFLAKPIGGGLAGRRRQIKEELEALQAKRDEAELSYKEFETRLSGMEKEMETVVEKAIAMAEDEKVRILKEAEESAEDIKRQATAAVQAAVVEAKRTLQNEVAESAAAMAEELIVKNLTPADQVTITEQYLEKVGAVQ